MRQKISPSARPRARHGGHQPLHQILHVDRAKPALAPRNLNHQAPRNRFQQLEYVRIARPVDHRGTHVHARRGTVVPTRYTQCIPFETFFTSVPQSLPIQGNVCGTASSRVFIAEKRSQMNSSKRWFYAIWLVLIGGFAALHAMHLSADFPNNTPWFCDWAKYNDEGWDGNAAISEHKS